jgi:hypothetical protein
MAKSNPALYLNDQLFDLVYNQPKQQSQATKIPPISESKFYKKMSSERFDLKKFATSYFDFQTYSSVSDAL